MKYFKIQRIKNFQFKNKYFSFSHIYLRNSSNLKKKRIKYLLRNTVSYFILYLNVQIQII